MRLLSAALELRPRDEATPVPPDVIELAQAGEFIPAVRALRRATGLGLVQATRLVKAVPAAPSP